eukprot:2622173-Rhodomonas_salina.1
MHGGDADVGCAGIRPANFNPGTAADGTLHRGREKKVADVPPLFSFPLSLTGSFAPTSVGCWNVPSGSRRAELHAGALQEGDRARPRACPPARPHHRPGAFPAHRLFFVLRIRSICDCKALRFAAHFSSRARCLPTLPCKQATSALILHACVLAE